MPVWSNSTVEMMSAAPAVSHCTQELREEKWGGTGCRKTRWSERGTYLRLYLQHRLCHQSICAGQWRLQSAEAELAGTGNDELKQSGCRAGARRGTYWVNFHVVGFPSASTMILDKGRRTPAECDEVQRALGSAVWRRKARRASTWGLELVRRPGMRRRCGCRWARVEGDGR